MKNSQMKLFDYHASDATTLLLKVSGKGNDSQTVSICVSFFRKMLYSENASGLTFQSVTTAHIQQNLLEWLIADLQADMKRIVES